MSMFPSLMRDFNDDFFSGPMESMRRMESMIDSMMSPFGGMFGSMGLQPPPVQGQDFGRPRNRAPQNGNMLMPFGFGGSLFPNMDNMLTSFGQMSQNPHCHSFSSSSVMTYTTDETGVPQVYQATASTRTAPGGVKETRRSVQDSRTGLQEMAIGHHLDDRAHVVEKKKNRYTGEEEENHEFLNIDDEEAPTFDNEWQQRAQTFPSRPMQPAIGYGQRWRERSPENEVLAITDGTDVVEQHASLPHASVPRQNHDNPGGKKKSGTHKSKRKHGSNHKSGHSHGRPSPYE